MSEQAIEWVKVSDSWVRLNVGGHEACVWNDGERWLSWVWAQARSVLFEPHPTEAEARAAALKAIRRDAIDAAKLMGKVVAAVTAELGDSL